MNIRGLRFDALRRTMAKRHAQRGETDRDSIKKRIERTVERGDLIRERAYAKYREIRERKASENERTPGERR